MLPTDSARNWPTASLQAYEWSKGGREGRACLGVAEKAAWAACDCVEGGWASAGRVARADTRCVLPIPLSPTKTKNQWDDKPQGVRRGVRRAVAAGVLLSFWPAGEALAVDAGATVPACVEINQ